ncbi:Aste57867_23564 [Aphanomyces stellatus]|uniref:Kinesin-like protein n=1 Tax=Aphanomyces stellatus TaxID=120398 RepID=A0A485LP31_9STRA|nr:hypothetical protein As57867_023493 [Aphanomyces stellatus]VFU00209.1 Aste57867_23564 [Aphanomyces stellatus]
MITLHSITRKGHTSVGMEGTNGSTPPPTKERRTKSMSQASSLRGLVVEPPPPSPARIQVFVRVRPTLALDDTTHTTMVSMTSTTLRFPTPTSGSSSSAMIQSQAECSFDRIFPPDTTQCEMFASVEPLMADVLQGCNATIFAYGQTGTGKTHTMLGMDDGRDHFAPVTAASPAWGIIPRALCHLVDRHLSEEEDQATRASSTLSCAYVEVYNDKAFDLIADKKRQRPLALRESSDGSGPDIPGLTSHTVQSVADAMAFLKRGRQHRAVRETDMNGQSSRSHAILQVTLREHNTRKAKLNLVDLAGSEKWRPQEGWTRPEIDEMKHINTSLSALGNCIAALTQPGRKHIPFRDSTLTRLLQDSLGGRTRTVVIATINGLATDETIRTIQFADRTRAVMQCATVKPVDMTSHQLHKGVDLTTTCVKVAELTRKLEKLALEQEKQAALSKQYEQKWIEGDHKLHQLKAQLAALTPNSVYGQGGNTPVEGDTPRRIHGSSEHTPLKSPSSSSDVHGARVRRVRSLRRQEPRRCNEVFFAILFIAAISTVVAIAAANVHQASKHHDDATKEWMATVALPCAAVTGLVALLSFGWTMLLFCCPRRLFWVMTTTSIVCVVGVTGLASTVLSRPYKWLPLAIGSALVLWHVTHRVCTRRATALTSTHVQVSRRALWSHPHALVALVFCLCLVTASWTCLWLAATYATLGTTLDLSNPRAWGAFLTLSFVYLWTILVIRHVVFVAMASYVASWWCQKTAAHTPSLYVSAMTTSLGSISFGSFVMLVAAPLQWILAGLLAVARRTCGLATVAAAIKSLAIVDSYAFVYVGLHGRGFISAGHYVRDLFGNMGRWPIIAKSLLFSWVVWWHAISVGLVGALLGWLTTRNTGSINAQIAAAATGCLAGMSMVVVGMAVLQAAVATSLVLFAEDPFFLFHDHEQDHEDIHAKWNERATDQLTQNPRYIKAHIVDV